MRRFYISQPTSGEYILRHHDGVSKGYNCYMKSFDHAIQRILVGEVGSGGDYRMIEIILEDSVSSEDMRSDYAIIKWHNMQGCRVAHVDLESMAKLREKVTPGIDNPTRLKPVIMRGVAGISRFI